MSDQDSSAPIWLYGLIIAALLAVVGWRFVGARMEAQRQQAAEAEQAAKQAKAARKEALKKAGDNRDQRARERK
jgi:hypothetical protein